MVNAIDRQGEASSWLDVAVVLERVTVNVDYDGGLNSNHEWRDAYDA